MQSFSQAGRPEVNSTKQTYYCDFTILIAVATSAPMSAILPGRIKVLPCLAILPKASTYFSATLRLSAINLAQGEAAAIIAVASANAQAIQQIACCLS